MCGITGFARLKATAKTTDETLGGMMKDAVVTGSLRGTDSVGYFALLKGKDQHFSVTEKVPVNALHLHEDMVKEWQKVAVNSQAFVMHHRAATIGKLTTAAAHPHRHEIDGKGIIGVHNGTLNTWYSAEDNRNFVSDSSWLMYSILKLGAVEALRKINGPYAIVYRLSDEPDHVYFARNHGRPLQFMWSEDKEVMIFGSEVSMLYWLYGRQTSWGYQKTASIDNDIFDFQPEKLYKLDINDMKLEIVGDLAKPVVQYTPPTAVVTHTPYIPGTTALAPTTTTTGGTHKHPSVALAEHDAARDEAMLGDVVYFRPVQKKVKDGQIKYVSGDALTDNGDQYEARFRGVPRGWQDAQEFMSLDYMWRATIVGIGKAGKNKADYLILSDLVEVCVNLPADWPTDKTDESEEEESDVVCSGNK